VLSTAHNSCCASPRNCHLSAKKGTTEPHDVPICRLLYSGVLAFQMTASMAPFSDFLGTLFDDTSADTPVITRLKAAANSTLPFGWRD